MASLSALLAVLLSAAAVPTVAGELELELDGHWRGALVRGGAVVVVELQISSGERDDMGPRGALTILDWGLVEVPVSLTWSAPRLQLAAVRNQRWQLWLDPATGELAGRIDAGGGAGAGAVSIHLKRAPRPLGRPIVREPLRFDVAGVELAGTLVRPRGSGPNPGLVYLAGRSYPTRDDGLSVAVWLARRGFAVLAFDGRGTGQSQGSRDSTTADDRLADALAALDLLAARDDVRSDELGLYGASAGGWVGVLAADRDERVAFLVLEVAPAVGVARQQGHTVRYRMLWSGQAFTIEELDAAEAYQRRLVSGWVSGAAAAWAELSLRAEAAREERWAAFVSLPDGPDDEALGFFQRQPYDPGAALRRLKIPVLAFYGGSDARVPAPENVPELTAALEAAGNADVTVVVFEQAGHGLFVPELPAPPGVPWPAGVHRWARKAPGYWDTLGDWLAARVTTAGR